MFCELQFYVKLGVSEFNLMWFVRLIPQHSRWMLQLTNNNFGIGGGVFAIFAGCVVGVTNAICRPS